MVFCAAEILVLISPVPVLGIYLALSPVHCENAFLIVQVNLNSPEKIVGNQ